MASHRYWRVKNIVIPGGGYLEISEWQLFNGATRVDAGATMSSSSAPDSGALSSLVDNNTGTRCYWAEATAEGVGFWIKWDLGAATEVTGTKFAGFDTSTRYPSAFSVEWSDNDADWTLFGNVSSVTYPGNGTFTALLVPALPGPVIELDATTYTSGQTWANTIATPGDGSGQTAYDYMLGGSTSAEGSDPTFVSGVAHFSFDGGDCLTLQNASTSFLKAMHKAGQKFTIEVWMQWAGTTGGNVNPIFDSGTSDQGGSDMSRGVIYADLGTLQGTAGKNAVRIKADSGAGNAFTKAADNPIPTGSIQMIALSYDGSGATDSFFYRNGNYDPAGGVNTWAVSGSFGTSDATNKSRIGARGDASALVPAGTKIYFLRVYNTNLTKAELDARWTALKGRYGYTFYEVAGMVRLQGVPVARTVRLYSHASGQLLDETVSSDGNPGVGDANIDDVSLLLHLDTDFSDSSPRPKTPTLYGSPQIVGDSKFGLGAMQGGSSKYAVYPSHADFNFGTGDFTLEAQLNITNFSVSYQGFLNIGAYNSGILFRLQSSLVELYINGAQYTWACTHTLGSYAHVAVTRQSGVLRAWFNGKKIGGNFSNSNSIPQGAVHVGTSSHSGGEHVVGKIDEVRITKGRARYTADFVPPKKAFFNEATTPATPAGSYVFERGTDGSKIYVVALDDAVGDSYNELILTGLPEELP